MGRATTNSRAPCHRQCCLAAVDLAEVRTDGVGALTLASARPAGVARADRERCAVTIDRLLLVLSTLAAAAAAYYAAQAVRDARVFHQEQERDTERSRLLAIAETLAELRSVAYTVAQGGRAELGALRAYHARFGAAVETTAEPIPVCRSLAAFTLGDESGLGEAAGYVTSQTAAASDELHAAIQRLTATP